VSLPPDVPQPVNQPNTKPATAEQLQDVQREMTGFERSTVRLAQIALGISILAAIFVCLQWWEMHEGGIDTHSLAEAADIQAKAADLDQRAWISSAELETFAVSARSRLAVIEGHT